MKLLILTRIVPDPYSVAVARSYYFMKFYASKVSITLISPLIIMHKITLPNEVKLKGCPVPLFKNHYSEVLRSISNRLTLTNIRYAGDFYVVRPYYPSLQKRIVEVLSKEDFDVIYADNYLSPYLFRLKLLGKIRAPTLLEFFSPTLYSLRQHFNKFGGVSDKLRYLFGYLLNRLFIAERYKYFDGGIYVSKTHLELSKPFVPRECFIIPPGVDIEYFKPSDVSPSNPALLFTGIMSYPPNVSGALWFYYKVYPYIKRKIPNVKLYIVGRDPDPRIKGLSSDKSVIITGKVEDIRPYFAKAMVFINPIILDDGGIKNKVLEAMAMGKAIVSTPLGVRDLGVTHGKNIVIAANEAYFASKVIELLKDENENRRLCREARRFIEENYPWEKQSKMLYDVLKFMVEEGRGTG